VSTSSPVRLAWAVAVAVAFVLALSGCGGSSPDTTDGPTTSFRYLVDPLEPGTGFIQLGPNRYPFDGVICATGPVESDPEGSTRVFGVYANFEVDGALAAVALTRYHNEIHGKTNSVPTLTETALIQMQGHDEIKGLSAKRFQIVGERTWQDPNDPSATKPLITRSGDRYEARGTFAPVNADAVTSSTTPPGSAAAAGASDAVVGEVAARCPAASTATSAAPTTQPSGSPSTTTPPSGTPGSTTPPTGTPGSTMTASSR